MAKFKPTQVYDTPFPGGDAVDFDPLVFDEAVESKGVVLEHWSAMRCPVGIIDKYDSLRKPHPDHEGCSNGFLYSFEGCVQVMFHSNSRSDQQIDLGVLNPSTAMITFPRFYMDEPEKPVIVAPFDRLYLKDKSVVVPNWELIEASPSANDRLSFPAVKILNIVDNRGIKYQLGDYELLKSGILHWLTQKQPGLDQQTGKGRIYTARYFYLPYWYVDTMIHEIRISQVSDGMTGERRGVRLPQMAKVQREYVYESQQHDLEAKDATSARQQKAPADGSFPAR